MTPAARASLVFGAYLGALGLWLLAIPNVLLDAFGFEPTNEVWIRVIGFMLGVLSHYYLSAAYREDRGFFAATIIPRLLALPMFGIFVWAGWAPAPLLLFAVPEVAGALWTRAALDRR